LLQTAGISSDWRYALMHIEEVYSYHTGTYTLINTVHKMLRSKEILLFQLMGLKAQAQDSFW
jgi:hypothetical protein